MSHPEKRKIVSPGPDLSCSTESTNAKKVSRACVFVSRACFSAEVPLLSPRCNTFTPYVCHKCAFSVGKTSPRNLSQSRRNKNTTYVHSSGRRIICSGGAADCTSAADRPSIPTAPASRPRRRLPPTPRRRPLDGRTCRTPTQIPASVSARHRARRISTSYARVADGQS